MRIGVVCEGPTDFPAIQSFLGDSLGRQGIRAEFDPLQPAADNTQGGWGPVLSWLEGHPPASRIREYFGGGLFSEELASPQFDVLLIHLDSDILGDASFETHLKRRHQYTVKNPGTPAGRAKEISSIIAHVGQFSSMTKVDRDRHVPAPAVESTETWCVAAFATRKQNFERLSGQPLIDAFMSALEGSEERQPQTSYGKEAKKSVRRRKRYCERLAGQSSRVISGCPQFGKIHQALIATLDCVSSDTTIAGQNRGCRPPS